MNEEMIADYVSGITTKELVVKYGKTPQQIHRIMRLAGVSRKPGGVVTYDPQIAINMWNEGKTLDEIANHLKVNRSSVYEQLKKFNVDTERKIDVSELLILHSEGLTLNEIACRMGYSETYITQELRNNGVHNEKRIASLALIAKLEEVLTTETPTYQELIDRFPHIGSSYYHKKIR